MTDTEHIANARRLLDDAARRVRRLGAALQNVYQGAGLAATGTKADDDATAIARKYEAAAGKLADLAGDEAGPTIEELHNASTVALVACLRLGQYRYNVPADVANLMLEAASRLDADTPEVVPSAASRADIAHCQNCEPRAG